MNAVLKIFLSMSFSGGLLILALLLGKHFLKDKISRQWQYYIWLVVVLRLLLPFGPEVSLLGKTYQAADQAITQAAPLPSQQPAINAPGNILAPTVDLEKNNETVNSPAENSTTAHPLQEIWGLLANHVWLVWLVVALGLLIRKITVYQGFIRYIYAGLTPVSDIELLDRLSIVAEQAGIKKPIELCINPLVSSPLLTGFFHPCIVLPNADISEKDFQYIVLHELTHYKRRDMFYKWLVQITVCLHWFNPLVYLMSREVTKACEFSCDEAVLAKMGCNHAQDYGKTLLDAMAAVGKYKENLGAVTLGENKELLKERLGAIMNFEKKSKAVRLLTGALTLCVIVGAAFVGVYPTAAASNQPSGEPQASKVQHSTQAGTGEQAGGDYAAQAERNDKADHLPPAAASNQPSEEPQASEPQHSTQVGNREQNSKDYASLAERYYMADSLPLFEITFPRLNENAQRTWLEKLYTEGDFAFFSVAVRGLDTNSSLFADFAEKAYADEEIAFFSTLTDCMNETELELWLDRALEDGMWDFQSMLFDKLDRNDEFDELKGGKEKEWGAAQEAEYQAVGVTMDGKDYYYQGKLVNIFLDIRANNSYYTLNVNPAGTVNVRIIRDTNDKITSVAYMTEAEAAELLSDRNTSSPVATSNEQPTKTDIPPSSQQSEDWETEFNWDWDDEKDKKWDEARRTEYQAIGVTVDGKNYFYQGQLVNIFMDIRANQSFYVLDTNPAGTVNIKIIRDANNKITGVTYMTEAEAAELLDDMA